MNILIAGGAGLIGSAIARHLGGDHRVLVYDLVKPEYGHWVEGLGIEYDIFIDCSWPKKPSDQFKTWNTIVDHFKKQRGGKMILFSSIYGHKAPDFGMYECTEIKVKPIEYCMLKAATEQATRYLAQKLKPWGIQVNAICPGGVLNKESEVFQEEYRTSGGVPMIQTQNLLPIIDALLHKDNAINGQVIVVDGGWTL